MRQVVVEADLSYLHTRQWECHCSRDKKEIWQVIGERKRKE